MTKLAEDISTQRYIMGLYYAYGRKDAGGVGCYIDPLQFAEFYQAQWNEFTNGNCSFCPSVQDAFDIYRRSIGS